MTVYAYVENEEIKEIFYVIPQSWKNISNFHLLPAEELKNYNWYIVKDVPVSYDDTTEEIYDVEYKFIDNEVLRFYLIRNKIVESPTNNIEDTTSESSETI